MRCCVFMVSFLFIAAIFLTAATVQGALVSYWNFDEASGNALDAVGTREGAVGSEVVRVPGLIGDSALEFVGNSGSTAAYSVSLTQRGATSFSDGITVETLIQLPANWIFGQDTGTTNLSDYNFTFGSMGLFGFQKDQWTTGFAPHTPVLTLGLDTGGWGELDMPLDGVGTRPSMAYLTDGNTHHLVGTYDKATGVKAIYVDGVEAMSINYTPGTPLNSQAVDLWHMGRGDSRGEGYSVIRDEMAVYNHALSGGRGSPELSASPGRQ